MVFAPFCAWPSAIFAQKSTTTKTRLTKALGARVRKKISYFIICIFITCFIDVFYPAKTSDIYVEVFLRLINEDDTYGGKLNPKIIYISRAIDDPFYRANTENNDEKLMLDERAVSAISAIAQDIGVEIRWINSSTDLNYNKVGEITGGGVLVEFGKLEKLLIYSQIVASIYIANEAAGGTRYEFYKLFNKWKFTRSDIAWIS